MISNKSMNFLFETLNFYDEQYGNIAESCYEDVLRALTEINECYLPADTEVLPYGCYHLQSNYQLLEPMEFYVVLHGDKESLLARENEQKQEFLKSKKKKSDSSIKNIYKNILSGSSTLEQILTSFDVANIIMTQMQKYLSQEDIIYYKNNVVFVKFHTKDQTQVLALITIVYNFENDKFEFKKYGISTIEESKSILKNISIKNEQTNGKYLILCKLIKMLELELIINNTSTKYLSKKSLFVEQLLYNVPNVLYESDDFCQLFANITNYIKNCNISDLLLADNVTKMFAEHSYYAKNDLLSFIKKLIYLSKNTDKMIDAAINNNATEKTENQNNDINIKSDMQNQQIVKKLGK